MLYVDQALAILPPTIDPPGPGVAVLGADGAWRHRGGGPVEDGVQAKVARVGAELITHHFDYVWGVTNALKGHETEGFVEVPRDHPSYDPRLDQRFAPPPPALTVSD